MSDVTLLPPNATRQERAIDQTTSRIGELEVPIRDLWRPESCPERLLPWLAWALSVDEWDSHWSAQQKRDAIDASVFIHRHKGTPAAVQRAVDVVFSDAEVEEWFDYNGEPFHFRVVSQGAFTSEGEYRRLIRLIEGAQNARSWLDAIVIRSRIEQSLYFATATAQGNRTWMGPRPAVPEVSSSTIRVGSTQHQAHTLTIRPQRFSISVTATALTWRTARHESRKLTIRG